MTVKVNTGEKSASVYQDEKDEVAFAYAIGRSGVLLVVSGLPNDKPASWRVTEAWAPTAWVSVTGRMFTDGTLEAMGKNV